MSRLSRGSRWSSARFALVVSLACFAFGVASAWAQSPPPAYSPGEVIIKFAPTASAADIQSVRSDLGATQLTKLSWIGASRERIVGYSVEAAVARYRTDHRIAFIEPNYIIRLDRTPNDALFSQLWGMQNTGQTGGTPGADIRATNAWDIATGSSSVLVAIIDTGIDYTHPDLTANVWTNPGEIPGNGIDDDGNGHVDDIHGYDFANGDGNPMDDHGHGTHVSGTIGAVGDNSIGVAGVSWNVKLMGLKFLDGGGSGTTANAILAVQYATQMGARVMNNSWGGGEYSEALRLAIQTASDEGILFVAAAGNVAGNNNDLSPHYPSSYDVPLVVSVASTDHNDLLSSFSCYGPTSVDLAAPGTGILSTMPGSTYGSMSGTSMATPHVSGALALMLAQFPGMSGADAKLKLLASVDPLPGLAGMILTGGRLNVFTMLAEPDSLPPAAIGDLSVATVDGEWATLAWTATGDDGIDGRASHYDLRYSTSPITAGNFDAATPAPGPANPQLAGSPETVQVSGLAFNTDYWFAIKALDEYSNPSPVSNIATGTTLGAPDIAVTPDSLSADLFTGEQTTRTLNIANTGLSGLSYQVFVNEAGTLPEGVSISRRFASADPGAELQKSSAVGMRRYDAGASPTRPPLTPVLQSGNRTASVAASGPALRILMVNSGGDDSEIRGLLSALPDVEVVDEFDASTVAPALELLRQYHAAIVTCNLLPADPAGIGNVLADYADGGGGVVLTVASFINGWNISGRFLTGGYFPFTLGSGPIAGSTLGSYDPAHPIMSGVTTLWGDLLGQTDVASGAQLVASYASGLPLVATQGHRVVGVNVYFGGSGYWTGDVPILLRNAVRWSGGATWLSASPMQGVVPAGTNVDVTATFDATGLFGGDYDANVVVESNDPDESSVSVPAHLRVTGAPDIALSDSLFAFGNQFIGAVRTDSLLVRNEGTDLLDVTSLSTDGTVFSAEPASFQVAPGASQSVFVRFAPTTPGPITGTLTILSNDPDEASLSLPLSGTGLVPPDIAVTPDSLSADLLTGGQATRTLTIANTGGSDLSYEIAVRDASVLAASARISQRFTPPVTVAALQAAADSKAAGLPSFAANSGPLRAPLSSAPSLRGLSSTAGAGLRLLLVNVGGDDSEIRGQLAALPGVAVLDEFNGSYGVPTLELLRQYSSAIVIIGQSLPDPVGLGDVLADYADQGGGVVLTVAAFSDGYQIQGRLLTGGYVPFTVTSGWIYSGTLGAFNPSHPIMSGVAAVSTGLAATPALAPGAQWVASYTDGTPLVATQGSNVVGVNLYFGYSGYWTGDAPAMIYNAAAWAGGVRWLSAAPPQGIVPAGGSVDVTATFDAAGLFGGDYDANVVVGSNDPDEQAVSVPAHLRVTGAPDIALSDSALAFGELFIGAVRTDTLLVRNEGTDLLAVTSLGTDVPAYSVEPTSFQLAPGASQPVLVHFVPAAPGPITGTLTILSDDPDEASLSLPLSGTGLVPPDIAVTPDSLSVELFTGQQTTRTLTIANTGGSALDFTVGTAIRALSVPVYPEFTVGKGELDPRPGILGLGGPDLFGYTWRDSDEPGGPVFSWVDITGIGSPLSLGGDDATITGVPVGFDFPFYGNTFNTVNVSTNGFLSFTSSSAAYGNYPLPSPYAPGNLLAVLWNDLYVTQGNVYAYYNASRCIISYIGVPRLGGGLPQTFQVILYPSGRIVYQYLTCTGTWDTDATVGIQNATGSDGLTVEYNTASLHNNLAVELGTRPNFLTVAPGAGTIPAGGSLDLTATFDATGLLGGDYDADVTVESNDPDESSVNVPARLRVTGAPDIAFSDSALAFGEVLIGAVRTDTLLVRNEGTDLLEVTSLSTVPPVYTVEPASFQIEVGQSRAVLVRFAPTEAGAVAGTLTIVSNDPGEGTLALPLSGTGLLPPDIVVTPDSLAAELFTGQQATRTMTIANTGASALTYDISVRATSALAASARISQRFTPAVTGAGSQVAAASTPAGLPSFVANARPLRAPLLPAPSMQALSSAAGAGLRILLVNGGGDVSEILGQLAAMPGVAAVDEFNGNLGVPTLDLLRQYSSTIMIVGGVFPDPVGLGNVLADYADQGGGVVLTAFSFTSGYQIQGRLMTGGYVPFATCTGFVYNETLGAFDPAHPIMQGVAAVSSSLASNPALAPGAQWVASYTDGLPLVATQGRRVVGVNLFFGASGYWTGDVPELMYNAAAWAGGARWLSAAPTQGVVAPGGSVQVTATFNATGLSGGDYRANVLVESNDPDESSVSVPAHLRVVGPHGDISVSRDSIDFGQLVVGQSRQDTLVVSNLGTDVLLVSSVEVVNDAFTAPTAGFSLAAGQSRTLLVEFAPAAAGVFAGSLIIHSNDPDEGALAVPLHGIAASPTAIDEPSSDVRFALRGLKTNPTVRDIVVAFSLPDAGPATLELIDISGRRVATQEVGSLGAGRHTVTLGGGVSHAPGVYLVRLSRAGQSFTVRAVVLR